MENFKISVLDTDYFVNEKKKCVTCRLNFFIKCNAFAKVVFNSARDYLGPVGCEVIGVAKMHPDDKFDVEIGKKVARAKAESLAYKKVADYFTEYIQLYYNKITMPMLEFMGKADYVIDHNNEYIAQF